jgi:crotonobetainyl-CoA:carnitine CoA-transferase CaiB-like acyl-CoA transferase
MLPLHGVKVLDLSSVIFGPLASQTLADFGAEVIKIEPLEGDSTRHTGPTAEPGKSPAWPRSSWAATAARRAWRWT